MKTKKEQRIGYWLNWELERVRICQGTKEKYNKILNKAMIDDFSYSLAFVQKEACRMLFKEINAYEKNMKDIQKQITKIGLNIEEIRSY